MNSLSVYLVCVSTAAVKPELYKIVKLCLVWAACRRDAERRQWLTNKWRHYYFIIYLFMYLFIYIYSYIYFIYFYNLIKT